MLTQRTQLATHRGELGVPHRVLVIREGDNTVVLDLDAEEVGDVKPFYKIGCGYKTISSEGHAVSCSDPVQYIVGNRYICPRHFQMIQTAVAAAESIEGTTKQERFDV